MRSLFISIGAVSVLAACGTPWKSDYSCPGMPDGVVCKSPMEVYRMTEHADHVSRDPEPGSGNGRNDQSAVKPAPANNFIPTRLPSGQQLPREALPIREPAQLMRVWIAPYPDAKDDFHFPGLVVTEITPRRWSFGEAAALKAKTLTPLQLDYQERAREGGGANTEIGEEAKTLTPRSLVQGMQQLPGMGKASGSQK